MKLFGTAWVVKDGAIVGRMVVSEGGWRDVGVTAQEQFKMDIETNWRAAATAAAESAVLEWGPIGRSWAEQRGAA